MYEAFSIAPHEAAASERRVVGTNVNGVEGLTGDNEMGLVVEPPSEALTAALSRLANASERARLATRSRFRAEQFTREWSVESFLGAHCRLASSCFAEGRGCA